MSDSPNYVWQPGRDPAGRSVRVRILGAVLISVAVTFLVTALVTTLVLVTVLPGTGLLPTPTPGATASLDVPDTEENRAAMEKLKEIREIVRDTYVEEKTDADLLDLMGEGLVGALQDPYSYYLTAEQYEQMEEAMDGSYSGIGATVTVTREGWIEIIEVTEGGPAEAAGLRSGDRFLEVDGVDVSGFRDTLELAALVRGPEGTEVDLVMLRPATGQRLALTVERKTITNSDIRHLMLREGIGYIQVKQFSGNISTEFRKALDDLLALGARQLVIDLRDNPGGSAGEVIAMLDDLLPDRVIATLRGRQDGEDMEDTWRSGKSMRVPEDMRYAILVNGYSASASELFSGCLRDHGKALLVGEQTFGKGSGTVTLQLSDGSAVVITTFRYFLPNGVGLEGEGLAPDVEVSLPEELEYYAVSQIPTDQDTQLQAALALLDEFPEGE